MVSIMLKTILPMSSIQTAIPVLHTTPGIRLIISTWVITLTPGMVTVAVAGGPLGSALGTHRGITHMVIMATIRHGMLRITTILITLPGVPITVITHAITEATTGVEEITAVVGTTAMPGMTAMISLTPVTIAGKAMGEVMIAVAGETRPTAMTPHRSVATYPPRRPVIPTTVAW